MNVNQIRLSYVRYIGAGAVAAAPHHPDQDPADDRRRLRESFKSLREKKGAAGAVARTEQDLRSPGDLRLADPGGVIALLRQLPGDGIGAKLLMGCW